MTCKTFGDLGLTTPLQTPPLLRHPTAHLCPYPIKGSQFLNTRSSGFVHAVPSAWHALPTPGQSAFILKTPWRPPSPPLRSPPPQPHLRVLEPAWISRAGQFL